MFRDILRNTAKKFKKRYAGYVDVQELFDHNHIKMKRTSSYEADDYGEGMISWSYRFTFDNQPRKRRFMQAVLAYPQQFFDEHVRWLDDDSNFNEEICVEAWVVVPEEKKKEFQDRFEQFVTQELIIKN